MAYCIIADLELIYTATKLAEVSGDPTGQTIDDDRVQKAIDDFAALMKGYIDVQYAGITIGAADPILNPINSEGAWIYLWKACTGLLDDCYQEMLDRLLKSLKAISKGELLLNVVPPEESPLALNPEETFKGNPRQMGRRQWSV